LLRWTFDREGETSLSLFFFRRAARTRWFALAELDRRMAERFDLAAATHLVETEVAIWRTGCRLGVDRASAETEVEPGR
jgi:hypothetical protein